jgi:hypothetical protein
VKRKRNQDLADLLAAAGATPSTPDEPGAPVESGALNASSSRYRRTSPDSRHERDLALAPILAAFTAAAPPTEKAPSAPTSPSHLRHLPSRPPRRLPTPLLVKCAAASVLATGCAVAAASAGVLPSPVQQFAHKVLGGIGVPPPGTPNTVPNGGVTAWTTPTPAPTATPRLTHGSVPTPPWQPPSPSAEPAKLTALCATVAEHGDPWRNEVSKDDRAALIAAAGGEPKVLSYCAALLAHPPSATAPPPAGAPGTTTAVPATAAASPDPSAAHGDPHPPHTPDPRPTEH